MKNLLIIGVVLTSFVLAQFTSETISAGSLFSYTSYKMSSSSDAESITSIGPSASFTSITLRPSISYFIVDNISVDAILSLNTLSGDGDNYKMNMYGIGASYYMDNIYGGGGFGISSSGYNKMSTSNYLLLQGGYLHKLSDNVFLDIGASYTMGMGKYKYDGEEGGDNEQTILRFGAGIKAFFRTK